jgi:hypothetical protein
MTLHAMFQMIYDHRFVLSFLAWSLLSSGIATLPDPSQSFCLYAWLYSWAHLFLNNLTPFAPKSANANQH